MAIKGVTQTRYWQSDGPIIPRKMGNAIRGKRKRDAPHIPAMQNYIEEETLSIPRDRRTNGNEIGENITIVKRTSGHGIYICGTSDKQGTVERVPRKDGWRKSCRNRWNNQRGIQPESGRNLEKLVERLKQKSYRPQPARRVEIAKENGKTRPLSIYCYEDKLVQEALKRIIEAVFEPQFYEEMMGFRPGRGCHKAIQKLNVMLEKRPTNYVLDADIKGVFDHIDHEWAVRFIEARIKDPNITRLVRRMLKNGIMKDYQYEKTEEGSGQGSVCSPIIANIYMHYVLVWWFKECIQPRLKGYGGLVVYADDFVCCFQYKEEAERFYEQLKSRMEHFGMTLEESKTRLIEFGRYAGKQNGKGKKPETFTFLGFTHYCSESRNGKFRVKRKTSKKKFAKKSKEINKLIQGMRKEPIKEIIKKLNQVLVGYYHYYGITDNSRSLSSFRLRVMESLYRRLNRRSQKKSYSWKGFNEMLRAYPIANPRIYVNVYAG